MGAHLEALIAAWNEHRYTPGLRNTLEADEDVLRRLGDEQTVVYPDWNAFRTQHDHFEARETPLHLGLLPMPYLGNLRTARVFLLSLNPGLGAHDYFGEHCVEEYRTALDRNLRQSADSVFPFLMPQHAWHGGAGYWRPRLRQIVVEVRRLLDLDHIASLQYCAQRIAVLELVPYHSAKFGLSSAHVGRLVSTRLMQSFVFEELLPRQNRGECTLIVLRARERWLHHDRPGIELFKAQLPSASMPLNAYIGAHDLHNAVDMLVRG